MVFRGAFYLADCWLPCEAGRSYLDTTPFQKKDVEPGGRLTALYEINGDTALRCVVLSSATLLKISQWINQTPSENDIAIRCDELLQKALAGSPDYVVHRAIA
jgi:hypothetical protein